MVLITTLGTVLLCAAFSDAASILYVIPFTSRSHYILLRAIGLELAERGHNVTVIAPFKEDVHPPNYHEVTSDDIKIWEANDEERPNVFTMTNMPMVAFHKKILWIGGVSITEIALKSKNVQEFLKTDSKFDLVICELFYQEAFYALAHKYNAPLVLVTTYGNSMKTNIMLRNPTQMATVLNEFIVVKNPTSFFGRLKNLYFNMYELYYWHFHYMGNHEALVRKYIKNLPQPVPSLEDILKNTSLVLMNGHFSVDASTAYLPNFIEVGGMHLKESNNKLPEDLKKILDDAKDGVVYVNFGTNIRSTELPEDKKNAFLNVFRRLKETVLWKWEDPDLEDKPDNVIIRDWLPQKEIFTHPNVKVFVSHGGLIGTQEAIFNGIPIIGIPIYADQYNNLLQVQDDGHGKILELTDLTENSLDLILNEVLKDDNYNKRAKEIQARFKDRSMSALDTAMFWIEYVIRHKGADFAKNPALKLSWISSNMLDVYGFILFIVILILATITKVIKLLVGLAISSGTDTQKRISLKKNK